MTRLSVVMLVVLAALPAAADPIQSLKEHLAKPGDTRGDIAVQPLAGEALTKPQAVEARQLLAADHLAFLRSDRDKEWNDKAITIDKHTLKWKARTFGEKPEGGWNLYISMHGGGNTAPRVNDQQWENQIKLYQPKDSLYIAPRAPTNNWNLWHEPHIDLLFTRLIEDAIAIGEVNPNRVYIMGYSAGGDGVYQLAPRMADRLAAASMMAGHPNDASPLGLRNIGFTIHVGALDGGFNRNKVAAEWKQKLADLQKADPKGYVHEVQIHEGRPHWMNLEDKVAVEWMAKFTRNPYPSKVVWRQAGTTHERFYWLAMPKEAAKGGQLVIAEINGQEINLEKVEAVNTLIVRFSDAMLDLDKEITVTQGGKALWKGVPKRTIAVIAKTLTDRGDPANTFEAETPAINFDIGQK